MSTTTTTTPHFTRVQSAIFAINHPEKTIKEISRKFSITPSELEKSKIDLQNGKLLKKTKKHWNPTWDNDDVIFHADDVYLVNDYQSGSSKQSTLSHGLFDSEYDAINGGYHYRWSEDDVRTLLLSLPYRVLEIMRDSVPGTEDYEEAVLFMDSSIFKAVCKHEGLDHEEILLNALLITKADI
ncbi:MAG: hypothetical protein ACI9T7_000062 [Oleiphilaceae bacterium]|jgi:hypothetical protein